MKLGLVPVLATLAACGNVAAANLPLVSLLELKLNLPVAAIGKHIIPGH